MSDPISETILGWYIDTLCEVENNRNLTYHKAKVEMVIEELDLAIADTKARGIATDSLEELRNEVFYLKYEIAERT
jgi:hypothetical protein